MTSDLPHYLLFAEASRNCRTTQTWRFVLQNLDTQRRFSATDVEETASSERLELLAVVRGLEALAGPARVTLVTRSRYVSRGLRFAMDEWRANNWRWERFGRHVAVRDHDLWKRVDRALEFHQVDCQTWHFEESTLEFSVASPDVLVESPPTKPTIFPETRLASRMANRPENPCPSRFWRKSRRRLRPVVGASA
ncbi:MAG: hypothetical protein MI725_05805 [Pirellulales bacterium]|nr:hypothetical protein [Pirellulales bacterium]